MLVKQGHAYLWQAHEIDEAHLVQAQQSASTYESQEDGSACDVTGEATHGQSPANYDDSSVSAFANSFAVEMVHDAQILGAMHEPDQVWRTLEHEIFALGTWGIPSANDVGVLEATEESFDPALLEPLTRMDEEDSEQTIYYSLPSIRDNYAEEVLSVAMGLYRDDQTLVGSDM